MRRIAAILILGYGLVTLIIPPTEQRLLATHTAAALDPPPRPASPNLDRSRLGTDPPGPIPYLYEPNTTAWIDGWYSDRTVAINSKGLREEPFNRTPPPGTTRILVLGGSFTFGRGLNVSHRYTNVLERWLAAEGQYQVISAGIGGGGLADFTTYYQERGQYYNSDLVIVSINGLDIWSRSDNAQYRRQLIQQNSSLRPPLNSVERSYINKNKQERKIALYRNATPDDYTKKLEEIYALTGSTPMIVYPYLMASARTRWIQNWATNHQDVRFVGPGPEFTLVPGWLYKIPYDGHYNRLGHYWMAETLYDTITSMELPGTASAAG